jgi:hypothetical protein
MADIESHNGGPGGLPAPVGPAGLRASHEDRDKVAEVLRVAAGDGRLSPEELDERLERALTAKTYAELEVLTTDLPAAPGGGIANRSVGPVSTPEPKDLMRVSVGSGRARREGRWVVPRELEAKVTSGRIQLDLTQAVITEAVLRISADVRSGGLTLITKPGIVVDVDDVRVGSGRVKVHVPWGHDVPALLRVVVSGSVRSGRITARPAHRSFWEWLRRAPRRYALSA